MPKPSSTGITHGYVHHHYIPSKPSSPTIPDVTATSCISHFLYHHPRIHSPSIPSLPSSQTTYFSPSSSFSSRIFRYPPHTIRLRINLSSNTNSLVLKYFDFKRNDVSSKTNGNFVVKNAGMFSRHREAVKLLVVVFWKRNSLVLLGAGGVMIFVLLWRVLFEFAYLFFGLSEGVAKCVLFATPTAIVVAPAGDKKLLTVDMPMATGPGQHLFLIGDGEEYKTGGEPFF